MNKLAFGPRGIGLSVGVLKEYILLEHVKELTQWPFFENSVQKVLQGPGLVAAFSFCF